MSITAKSTVALLAIFLALFAGAGAILAFAVLPRFEQQEAAAHGRDLTRLEANLRAVAADMSSRTTDYAHWDDTYAYVTGRNPGYIDANFSDEWFADYGADFVGFSDESGRVLWSRARSGEDTYTSDPDLAEQLMLEAANAAPRDGQSIEGAIWTAEGPIVYGAARTMRSDGGGPARGLVVIGRRIDSGVLGEQLQLDVRLISASAAPAELADQFAQLAQDNRATWRTHDRLYALIALRHERGLIGAVLAEQPRDISALGARTIAVTLLLLSLMFACAIGALWFLLERMVIARLARMRSHFHAQSADAAPLPHDASTDEIGQLTDAYNALALRLRAAVESEQQALLDREAAAAANRMKSDFLANISHELRTPLNAVIGYAELIEEELTDNGLPSSLEDLHRITGAARHLLTLINEILDLSRIEGDRLEIRPEAFRVDEMLHSIVEAATPLARAQSNVLLLEFENDLGIAYNDQIRLRQSLVNVLAHACKRTHSNAVKLRVERCNDGDGDGDALCFTVVDHGPPLSSQQIAGLFELFVRVGDIQESGARLGLAVTRKLLELMGGSIEVNSAASGCTFRVVVPVEARDATPADTQAAA